MHIRELTSLGVSDVTGFTHDAAGSLPVGARLVSESLAGPVVSEWKPGDTVEWSGVYNVRHDKNHTMTPGGRYTLESHLICQAGKMFPPCIECGNLPRFVLVSAAEPIEQDKHFA
jgi:hypothetical protein